MAGATKCFPACLSSTKLQLPTPASSTRSTNPLRFVGCSTVGVGDDRPFVSSKLFAVMLARSPLLTFTLHKYRSCSLPTPHLQSCLRSCSLAPHSSPSHFQVTFAQIPDAAIRAYVATGEPMDKAGAYGIQAMGGSMVTGISGEHGVRGGHCTLRTAEFSQQNTERQNVKSTSMIPEDTTPRFVVLDCVTVPASQLRTDLPPSRNRNRRSPRGPIAFKCSQINSRLPFSFLRAPLHCPCPFCPAAAARCSFLQGATTT